MTLRQYFRRKGIQVIPFYYVKELLPADIPTRLTALPEGFEFGVFGEPEIAIIAKFPEHGETASEQLVLERFKRGHTCVGMKHQGEIVAFTWFALDATHSKIHPLAMQPNEAYLFNMYVVPEVRGHNLASILRYKSYEILRNMGRDTFYSITLTSNQASWRFKQKLNAQRMFLGVYVDLFGKFEGRWILRRY
jgi:ribosomal protein S18 acetylase RimI-like enzyme